ncbi:MAG: hypothetical protein H0V14_01520 [Chitinophagaceae bacterium]|nr:hypothetical protein [Chitinophagaceae bacterium]
MKKVIIPFLFFLFYSCGRSKSDIKKEYDHLILQEQINEGMLRVKIDSADALNTQGLYKDAALLYQQADSMVVLSKAMRDRRKKLAEHLFKVD